MNFTIIKENKNNVVLFFFIFCFIYNIFQVYEYAFDRYAFQYGDWLINYSNGFVRRGFTGEIIIILSNIFKNNIQITFFICVSLLIFVLYLKSYQLLKEINFNFLLYLCLFSPFNDLFTVLNHKSGIRKEYLFFLLIVFFISEFKKKTNHNNLWKYICFFPLILLSHEAIYIYLPFMVLLFCYLMNEENYKIIFFQIILLVIFSSIVLIVSFFFKGNQEYINVICDSLNNYAYDNCKTSGAIENLNHTLSYIFQQTKDSYDFKGIAIWIINFFIGFFPIIFILKKKYLLINNEVFFFKIFKNTNNLKKLKIFFLISSVSVLPLFILAIDWGRWLFIIYHLLFYNIIFLILRKTIKLKNIDFLSNKILFKTTKQKLLILVLIFYATFVTPGVFYSKNVDVEPIKFNYYEIFNN